MKSLICVAVAALFAFTASANVSASTTTTTVVTKTVYSCNKHRSSHSKRYYYSSNIYSPSYCESRRSNDYPCGCVKYCYPEHQYQCRTEMSYRHGRNAARVEVCN